MTHFRPLLILVAALILGVANARLGEAPPAEAVFPGANGKILFDDYHDIWAVNSDGSCLQNLTNSPVDDRYARWSPDGSQIVFMSDGNSTINIMNADGTDAHEIYDDGTWPSWSPDGRIVFVNQNDLYTMDSDGSGRHKLTNRGFAIDYPTWSPDGTRIAVTNVPGGPQQEIGVMNADGSGLGSLTPDESWWPADWSPDSQSIVYSQAGTNMVAVIDANGGSPSPIAAGRFPAWSPDGQRIVFTTLVGAGEIRTMKPDGTDVRTIVATGGQFLHWQPLSTTPTGASRDSDLACDIQVEFTQGIQELQTVPQLKASLGGSSMAGAIPQSFPGSNGKIAFQSAGGQVATINPDGSDFDEITAGGSPRWSPDGVRIAFTGGGITVMNADGSGASPLALGNFQIVGWSPSGNELLLAGGRALHIVNSDGTNLHRLTPLGVDVPRGEGSWSPDGSLILFPVILPDSNIQSVHPLGFENYDLFTIHPDGSGLTQITDTPGSAEVQPDWAPDGLSYVFRREVKESGIPQTLEIASASGAVIDVVASGQVGDPDWSPDGTMIAYRDENSIHVMNSDGAGDHFLAEGRFPDWQPRQGAQVEFTQATQELQSVSALQSDLAGDGQPPVPIVAGKEAAMRVYFGEVQDTQSFTVEVSGQVAGSEDITIAPGCTEAQRRSGDQGCQSIDFFFTPPAGAWSVRLVVKDFANVIVLDEEFPFTSVETDGLKVAYIPICVRLTAGAAPACPTNFIDTSAPDLMRKLFPAADDGIIYERLFVPPVVYDAPITVPDRDVVTVELRKRYDLMLAAGSDHDQLAGWLPQGGSPGTAGLSDPVWGGSTGHVSWQMDTSATDLLDAEHTLSHEIAHNLGLRHTHVQGACGAVDSNTDWPYDDSTIQQVGYDVFAREIMLDTQKDVMTYCTPPGSNIWVSPFSYNKLIQGNFGPQNAGPTGAQQQFLIISGTAQADGSAGTLDPAYVITSDVPADAPDPLGNHCLRLSGTTTFDYCFNLRFREHRSQAPLPSESFALRVPLPDGTTRVALAGGGNELAALEASPSAPTLDITEPQTGETWSGQQTITWSAEDDDGGPITYTVLYSSDGGATWLPIEVDTTDPQYALDTSDLAGSEILIRVLASDGLNTTEETTGPISLGEPVLWGDNDCDGSISSRDNQALSRFVLQQNALSQTQPCPLLGATVTVTGTGTGTKAWGDLDCDGQITSRDGQALLRNILQQNALSQTQPCPLIGEPVTTSTVANLPARLRWWLRYAL